MSNVLLRRYRLGKTSCRAIAEFSDNQIEIVRNDLMEGRPLNPADILIRWGCTSEYPRNQGSITINKSEAMHLTNNKYGFRIKCRENGISIPDTYSYRESIPISAFPVIVRPIYHSQGRRLNLVNSVSELRNCKVARKYAGRYYVSKFIDKDREFRIYCMSGRVLAMAEKKTDNPRAVAWNRATGNSTFYNMRWDTWHIPAATEGLRAFNISGLDFGGVDVMAKGDNVWVLEINAAPSLTSSYRQTCFSRGLDYIINSYRENGNLPSFDFPTTIRNYKSLIHPYLLENRIGERITN